MLIGQYQCKTDIKNRLVLPGKFRNTLGDKCIITKGLERNLIIVSDTDWDTLVRDITERPYADKNARDMMRYLFGNASYIEFDAKGRFIFPEYLRKYIALSPEQEVVLAGVNKYIEVWTADNWIHEQGNLTSSIESIAQKLNNSTSGNVAM